MRVVRQRNFAQRLKIRHLIVDSKTANERKIVPHHGAPKVETTMNARTRLPLTDGTKARLTKEAIQILAEDYGIVRGRVKKGSASEVVLVSPKRYSGRPVRGTKEVPLRDLLAVHVYNIVPYLELGDVVGYKLADGVARNLMPSNIVRVPKTLCEVKERKPYTRKAVTVLTERPADALSVHEQEGLLSEVFSQMRGVAYAILKPDRESKTGSESQADDVVQNVSLSLLEQIRAGKCNAVSRGQFFAFCFSAVQRAASWKLQAITNGVCRDVDHDEAEILLLRVKRLEGDLRERQGLSVEDNGNSPIEGIDPAWLAKQLERDADEKDRQERQQIKEEGRWDAAGLRHEVSGIDVEEKPEHVSDDVESEETEIAA